MILFTDPREEQYALNSLATVENIVRNRNQLTFNRRLLFHCLRNRSFSAAYRIHAKSLISHSLHQYIVEKYVLSNTYKFHAKNFHRIPESNSRFLSHSSILRSEERRVGKECRSR